MGISVGQHEKQLGHYQCVRVILIFYPLWTVEMDMCKASIRVAEGTNGRLGMSVHLNLFRMLEV